MHAGADLAPAARGAQRLAMFGGSFDPPHLGHLEMARAARDAFRLDHVVWVPAARPPHKPERILASAEARVEMLRLLLSDDDGASAWASIWTLELERDGPSFTVDTLRELRSSLHRSTELFLVLGADNLPGFPGWRDVETILALARPIVLPRSTADGAGAPTSEDECLRALPASMRARFEGALLARERYDVSSSEVRARLVGGEPASALSRALPGALGEYIEAAGFYRPA